MAIVIIGSGIAGVSFAEKYRALSGDAELILITRDHDGYYSRPLLSRGFSMSDIEQTIILKTFEQLRENDINVISNSMVTAINRHDRTIAISGPGQEKSLEYDTLILAQGSEAFIPPPLRPFANLFYCLNSLDDLKALRKVRQGLLNQGKQPNWAIIGGGLIGCEVASDLAASGDKVTLYHAMDRLMERQLVAEDSHLLLKVLHDSQVDVLFNQNVHDIAKEGDKVFIHTETINEFDAIIVACGFKPRTELADLADLAIGRGVKVNDYLQTSDKHIFALGDAAELPNGKLYAFILPIRSQAFWLAAHLANQEKTAWQAPEFTTKAKVHGFTAKHPYQL